MSAKLKKTLSRTKSMFLVPVLQLFPYFPLIPGSQNIVTDLKSLVETESVALLLNMMMIPVTDLKSLVETESVALLFNMMMIPGTQIIKSSIVETEVVELMFNINIV